MLRLLLHELVMDLLSDRHSRSGSLVAIYLFVQLLTLAASLYATLPPLIAGARKRAHPPRYSSGPCGKCVQALVP